VNRELRIPVSERAGNVGGILTRPGRCRWMLALAHGAGAGMRHPFMEDVTLRLAERGVATLRYQFPYMEQGRKRPDPPAVLRATVRAAVEAAAEAAGKMPLLAGGKSMGGRMTSLAASASPLPQVRGLVFFGFPLHAAGKPSSERGAHLADVGVPMLFLQGTRDRLAELDLLRPLCNRLGRRSTLKVVDQADHSFHVPRRSGIDQGAVFDELADSVLAWASKIE
jgi:predicted alpha/beta-hydrolase family hydrolase